MSSIWNLTSPIRNGSIKLLNAGRELYGTVIQHGVNNKTVTVSFFLYNLRSKLIIKYTIKNIKRMSHDPVNFKCTMRKSFVYRVIK